MNIGKKLLATLPVSAALLAASGSIASAAFPSIGLDNSGPSQLITFNSNGSVSVTDVTYATFPHPYDGADDTYIGVVNNTSAAISAIPLLCNNGCFGFDGDGIAGYAGQTGNSKDTGPSGGYGGPNAFFTSVNMSTFNSGTVNFITAIAGGGGTDYFSLEQAISATQITVGAVPLPSSWTMMLMGFAGLGFLSYRARKKTSEAIATA